MTGREMTREKFLALCAAPRWVPVTEALPERGADRSRVTVYAGGRVHRNAWLSEAWGFDPDEPAEKLRWYVGDGWPIEADVTHWHPDPLPASPATVEVLHEGR